MGKVFLGILPLVVIFIIGMTIVHTILTSKEKSKLAKAGYTNKVTVNGKNSNYNAYGKTYSYGYSNVKWLKKLKCQLLKCIK